MKKKSETSQPSEEAAVVFRKLMTPLEALGFSIKPVWRYRCFCDAEVRHGRMVAGRIELRVHERHFDLNIHPIDPTSIKLIGHYPGVRLGNFGPLPDREFIPSLEHLETTAEDLESKFRALLVMKEKLPHREFATDGSLKAWLGRAAAIPEDAAPTDAELLRREAAALLADGGYSRRKALELVWAAVDERPKFVADTPGEEARQQVLREAYFGFEGRLERKVVEWERQNFVGWMLPEPEPEEPSSAPAP